MGAGGEGELEGLDFMAAIEAAAAMCPRAVRTPSSNAWFSGRGPTEDSHVHLTVDQTLGEVHADFELPLDFVACLAAGARLRVVLAAAPAERDGRLELSTRNLALSLASPYCRTCGDGPADRRAMKLVGKGAAACFTCPSCGVCHEVE